MRNPAAGAWLESGVVADLALAVADGGYRASEVGEDSAFGVFGLKPGRIPRSPASSPCPSWRRTTGIRTALPSAGASPLRVCLGGSSGPGFGWNDVAVYKLGYEGRRGRPSWRAGYNVGGNPATRELVLANTIGRWSTASATSCARPTPSAR